MARAEQEHVFVFDLFGGDRGLAGQRVFARHGGHKGLVVEWRHGQAGVGKGLGQDGAIDLAAAQHLEQFGREVFLQHQGHLRRLLDHVAHQVRQQIRADGVDHAQLEWTGQRVFAALGDFFDVGRLVQHVLRLAHDLFTQGRGVDLVGVALKNFDLELFLEFFDGHGQSGLRHKAGFGRFAKVPLTGHGHDVFEFGQGHGAILRQTAGAALFLVKL